MYIYIYKEYTVDGVGTMVEARDYGGVASIFGTVMVGWGAKQNQQITIGIYIILLQRFV